MGLTDILIILGCLAGGYWLVSSVMGPGIDITRRKPPETLETPDDAEVRRDRPVPHAKSTARPAARPTWPATKSPTALLPCPANSHQHDWHIILDVPRTASRGDIESAFRHQQRKAEAARDAVLVQRLQQARDAALAALK